MTISPALFPAVTVTVVRDRKIQTALRTNQIAGLVTVPSRKKKLWIFKFLEEFSIFRTNCAFPRGTCARYFADVAGGNGVWNSPNVWCFWLISIRSYLLEFYFSIFVKNCKFEFRLNRKQRLIFYQGPISDNNVYCYGCYSSKLPALSTNNSACLCFLCTVSKTWQIGLPHFRVKMYIELI